MTSVAIRVFDETPGAEPVARAPLVLASERVTVRDLIARRLECDLARNPEGQGLLRRGARGEDAAPGEAQLRLACEAFAAGRFLLLVDDHQAEELEEWVALRPDSTVTFIRLLPLVGG